MRGGATLMLARMFDVRAIRISSSGCTACTPTISRSRSRGERRATTRLCSPPPEPCCASCLVRGPAVRALRCALATNVSVPPCTARDRALPTLFVDAPVLPAAAMGILEWLVGLGQSEDGEAASMEQCTLGLITLRDVVMHRQAERSACLALVLRCTVHADDVLRGKAIRMVVNQLHPLAFAAPEIESFASERLESVLQLPPAGETEPAVAPATTEETLRRISLYFALCTRADALLPRLFKVYAASGPAAQPAFHRNMVSIRSCA